MEDVALANFMKSIILTRNLVSATMVSIEILMGFAQHAIQAVVDVLDHLRISVLNAQM